MPIRASVDDFLAGEVRWRLDQRARVLHTLKLQRVDKVELIHLLPIGLILTGPLCELRGPYDTGQDENAEMVPAWYQELSG
ncbi:hypothetical protein DY000_02044181 [Brassica cretica]|uniref:Uncharacterized protein n=1 Tax=Brassica cretica TaxID=69181 RepID=A0ABQ7EX35_BRACR|nr:hypothetical protein DY000_02044181 [Brassica cretica]